MMGGTVQAESEYGRGSVFTAAVRQGAVECPAIGAELSERLRNFTFSGVKRHSQQVVREAMPYGKVLVVDDVDTNLYVAQRLLSPYKLNVETAGSGFETIKKVDGGGVYDIIFMDHMMPRMDGIETTKKLRGRGYKGVIVALTANALVGNDEMFMQNGFDGFISKPIDVRQLNAALNKFIRDRYPEEAKKWRTEAPPPQPARETGVNPKLIQIFRRDAEKASAVLRATVQTGDIKLFTTTAHAMKSALANVGENELSETASALEKAGQSNDTEYISANTECFVKKLETLTQKITPREQADNSFADTAEDTDYLKEQLKLAETACENYDDATVYAILDRLNEKSRKPETAAALEKILNTLILRSDFEEAAEMCRLYRESK